MSVATIHIENRPYEVDDTENLLQQCLTLGFDLPYFCWHPAMGSVGACRQCAVKQFKDEHDTKGKIVMACMTQAKDGTRISIDDPQAHEFRASVTEWMMVNHPHDCPVCDEGGECHLQDMTVMTGHVYRRYRGLKRTFRNQYLGPLVNHEMNRCIQCYRCTRFYRDYAGGRDFDALALRSHVYFGREADGTLESEFSGNLVEVCPTGVFTDKTLKEHYTRKWDLQTAPSVCVHCGLGCNTIPGERYGLLRRIRNRYNGAVNGYFLCDRGRYGYEFVNSERRIRQPMLRQDRGAPLQPATRREALAHLAALFSGSREVIGIGSPRASLEANFALRTLVGEDRFHLGVRERDARLVASMLAILQQGPARSASMHDVELADAVLVLGEDVSNTAPMLALALRQSVRRQPSSRVIEKLHIPSWDDNAVRGAVQRESGPLFIATIADTRLDDVATQSFHGTPDELARLGFAVAHAIDGSAPPVPDLPDSIAQLAAGIAKALTSASRPLVVSGAGCGNQALVEAAANVTRALCNTGGSAQVCFAVPECNSLGAAFIGGASLDAAFRRLEDRPVDTVVILENDLYRRADAAAVDAFLGAARQVVVIDHTMHATSVKADVILPAGTFAESDGTLVNNEGRAQRFFQVFLAPGRIQASWRWAQDIAIAAGHEHRREWLNLDHVVAACAAAIPALAPIVGAAPSASFRIDGQKIPRESHRYSGRTSMHAELNVHEPETSPDPDSALDFSMEGYLGHPPPPLIPRFWAPGWNSVQSVNKFQQEVSGPLAGGDPGVRLVEPESTGKADYFDTIPEAFEPRAGQWLAVPLQHIFGGEELSALAPGIAELAARPHLSLNLDDAGALGVAAEDLVQVHLEHGSRTLPVQLRASLPRGVAGLPADLPGFASVALPAWVTLEKGSSS